MTWIVSCKLFEGRSSPDSISVSVFVVILVEFDKYYQNGMVRRAGLSTAANLASHKNFWLQPVLSLAGINSVWCGFQYGMWQQLTEMINLKIWYGIWCGRNKLKMKVPSSLRWYLIWQGKQIHKLESLNVIQFASVM